MAWENKAVVVTGAAMGIGRYIALGCAERGANVAIADVDEEGLASVEGECSAFGHQVLAMRTDVQVESDVAALMNTARERFGSIDFLVNNAGIVPHFSWGGPRWPRVRDMEQSFFQRVIGTNLGGSFLCSKHAIRHMEAQGSGHIVNLHGGGSPTPPGGLAYVVSKEALVTFTLYLAEEVREAGICVLCLSPGGAIATERAPDEARQRMPGPESAGDRFFVAAEAPMELSGHLVDFVDGKLVPID